MRQVLLLVMILLLRILLLFVLIGEQSRLRLLNFFFNSWPLDDFLWLWLPFWLFKPLVSSVFWGSKSFLDFLLLSKSVRVMLDLFLNLRQINLYELILFHEQILLLLAIDAVRRMTEKAVAEGLGSFALAQVAETSLAIA